MRNGQSGKGNFGLIVFLVIVGFGTFFLFKYVPPRVNAYEFRDEMNKINTDPDYKMRRLTEEQVQDILLNKAAALQLPIEKKQIKVKRESDNFVITVTFQVPVDLKFMTMTQKYEFREPKGL